MSDLPEMVMEHDFRVALLCGAIFFILEFVVIALLLPWLLDRLAERKRLPVQQIAARRILHAAGDLLGANHRLILGIAAANKTGQVAEAPAVMGEAFRDINQHLAQTEERLAILSGGQTAPGTNPVEQSDPLPTTSARRRLRFEALGKFAVLRNATETVGAFDEIERTIDRFAPVMSRAMVGAAVRFYDYLAEAKRPFHALHLLLPTPSDPSIASISPPDVIERVRAICAPVDVAVDTFADEWKVYPDVAKQRNLMDDFLDLHFEKSPRAVSREIGLEPPS